MYGTYMYGTYMENIYIKLQRSRGTGDGFPIIVIIGICAKASINFLESAGTRIAGEAMK